MITSDDLKTYLGVKPADTFDDVAMAQAAGSANAEVITLRRDMTDVDPWPADVTQAALILGARVYGRRNSVEGLAGYEDIGAVPIPRTDPDVMRLLGLGVWQPSVIA